MIRMNGKNASPPPVFPLRVLALPFWMNGEVRALHPRRATEDGSSVRTLLLLIIAYGAMMPYGGLARRKSVVEVSGNAHATMGIANGRSAGMTTKKRRRSDETSRRRGASLKTRRRTIAGRRRDRIQKSKSNGTI